MADATAAESAVPAAQIASLTDPDSSIRTSRSAQRRPAGSGGQPQPGPPRVGRRLEVVVQDQGGPRFELGAGACGAAVGGGRSSGAGRGVANGARPAILAGHVALSQARAARRRW